MRGRQRFHSRGRGFQEEELVLKTVEALYNAWQEINFRAYFALWSPDAIRLNHWTGTRWDYDTIISRRIKAFRMYRQVWTRYTCEVKSFQASRAGVECLYDWIGIYKRSGKKEAEYLTKESYLLEKRDGTWLIVENHDYSNYQGGMFRWQGERLPSKREKRIEKALRKEAVAYAEKRWPTLRVAVDRGQIVHNQDSFVAILSVDRVLQPPQGSWLEKRPSVRLVMRSNDGLSWFFEARR